MKVMAAAVVVVEVIQEWALSFQILQYYSSFCFEDMTKLVRENCGMTSKQVVGKKVETDDGLECMKVITIKMKLKMTRLKYCTLNVDEKWWEEGYTRRRCVCVWRWRQWYDNVQQQKVLQKCDAEHVTPSKQKTNQEDDFWLLQRFGWDHYCCRRRCTANRKLLAEKHSFQVQTSVSVLIFRNSSKTPSPSSRKLKKKVVVKKGEDFHHQNRWQQSPSATAAASAVVLVVHFAGTSSKSPPPAATAAADKGGRGTEIRWLLLLWYAPCPV